MKKILLAGAIVVFSTVSVASKAQTTATLQNEKNELNKEKKEVRKQERAIRQSGNQKFLIKPGSSLQVIFHKRPIFHTPITAILMKLGLHKTMQSTRLFTMPMLVL